MSRRSPLVAAAAVAALLLSGCTAAGREVDRPTGVPSSLFRFRSSDCTDEIGDPPSGGGWSVDYAGAINVEAVRPDGSPDTSPEAVAWEDAMTACLTRYPIEWETEPWRWTDAELAVQYLYLTGPLAACLRGHGVEPRLPSSLAEYGEEWFPKNPYWELEGSLDDLLPLYRQCPPYADLGMAGRR
jgi:hypothetical protein